MELARLSALGIAELVRARRVSALEVTEEFLARIDRGNPAINAYVSVRTANARADAAAIDRAIAAGKEPGPLAGVPFSVKDLTATDDAPMTLGSRAFADFFPGVDAVLVARLKQAGAVLLGKTNTPEFGARPTTENELFGVTRNPWNPEHTSGGSSGGAAAACAAGLSPLAQGSDSGGSIRAPASCCGVYGLKPARARVTMGPLLSEEWAGLDVVGPITRTVGDAAAMLDVMAGPSTGDPYWAPPPDRTFASAVADRRPRRIAVTTERDGIPTDPAVRGAVEETASLLSDLGHDVRESSGPPLAPLEEHFVVITAVGIAAVPVPPDRLERVEERNRLIFEVARHVPATQYERAILAMHAISRQVVAFFDSYELLLTPTLTSPPPVIGSMGADDTTAWDDFRRWLAFTFPFNMTGQPAASVPAGRTPEGLPIGIQLVGRPADEHAVLSVSAELEEARPWTNLVPPTWPG